MVVVDDDGVHEICKDGDEDLGCEEVPTSLGTTKPEEQSSCCSY